MRFVPSRRLSGRAAWGIADQGLSSFTNLLVNVLVARELDTTSYGAFGLAYSGYLLLVGLLRGYLIEPFAVESSTHRLQRRFRTMLGAGTMIAGGAAVVLVPMVFLLPLTTSMRIAVGAAIPALVYVEVLRAGATASGSPAAAFRIDAWWAVVQVAGAVVGVLTGDLTGTWAVATWALGALAGGIAGTLELGAPSLSRPLGTLRDSAKLGGPWMLEFLLTNGTAQLVMGVIGLLASLSDVGAVRGGLVLIGPSTVLVAGLRLVLLPEMARVRRQNPRRLIALSDRMAAGFVVLTLASTLPILLLPAPVGRSLLGESWDAARVLLPWLIVFRAANAAANGPLLVLRALLDRRGTLSLRVFTSVASLGAAAVGAAVNGALGASVGLAAAFALTLPLWMGRTRRILVHGAPS